MQQQMLAILDNWRRTQAVQGSSLHNCHSLVRIQPTPRYFSGSGIAIANFYKTTNSRTFHIINEYPYASVNANAFLSFQLLNTIFFIYF